MKRKRSALPLLGTKEMQLSFLFGENNNISLGLLGLVSILAFHNPIFPIYEWNTGIFPSSIPSLWIYKLDSLMWAMKVSVSISFISHLLYCRSVYVRNYKQAHWNDFSVYHLILFGLNIGGRVGHEGEGIARKADVETLHCGRGLWEEIRWSRYRQSCGRSSAENYTLATGSWRSCWSDRWDIM